MALRRKSVQYERASGSEALLSQRLPGECWCAPVGTGTALVRKPTGIYWARGKNPNSCIDCLNPCLILISINPGSVWPLQLPFGVPDNSSLSEKIVYFFTLIDAMALTSASKTVHL